RSVVTRHELLRTRFQLLPGMLRPLQVISEEPDFEYILPDLSDLSLQAKEIRCKALLEETIDIEADPAHKFALCVRHRVLGPGNHLLALQLSAMYADAVTLHLLVRQINSAYIACRDGRAIPEAPVQYADVAETLNECLESEKFNLGREFWRKRVLAIKQKNTP